IGCHLGEVLPRFRFDSAEHVGGAATLVFAITPRDSSRSHRQGRTNLLVEHHRLLVHTNHRFPLTQRLFIHRQDVLHTPDVLLIQFRHASHFFPPRLAPKLAALFARAVTHSATSAATPA